jgi:hypothetical protein
MNTHADNTPVPRPTCSYEGSYLTLVDAGLQIGPFSLETRPGLALGYAVNHSVTDAVPVTTVRTAARRQPNPDPETSMIALGYTQNDVAWDMAFTVLTDALGGLVGTSFALDVDSNYPSIPMSIARTTINQPKLVVQTSGLLPTDYRAQLRLRFWVNEIETLPLDAWLAVQINYFKLDPSALAAARAAQDFSGQPYVTTHELLYYPAHGDTPNSRMLGGNYPAVDRHRGPKVLLQR